MMDISELEIGVRTYAALRRVGIDRVEQLLELEDEQLLAIPNFGRKSLMEVREALEQPLSKEFGDGKQAKAVNVARSVAAICRRLQLEPRLVRRIELTPRHARVTLYKLNSEGNKYLDTNGKPATELRMFEIKA